MSLRLAIPLLLTCLVLTGCSARNSADGKAYRKLSDMADNPATLLADLEVYADEVFASATDPDLRLVANFLSTIARLGLVLNYSTMRQFQDASDGATGLRAFGAFFTKFREYSAVVDQMMTTDFAETRAAALRCEKKYR